jgi:hypothetical protein
MKNRLSHLIVISLFVLVALLACSDNDSISSICDNHPELCSDIPRISDCGYKRTYLIRARYYEKTAPSNQNTLELIKKLNQYEACLESKMFIQYSKNKNRNEQRMQNYLATQKSIQATLSANKKSKNPHIAYYLWTQHNDKTAKKIFIKAASNKNTKDASLVIKLASSYAKYQPKKALREYFRALSLSHSLDELDPEVFSQIMTIYYKKRDFENAYIWSLIANKVDKEGAHIDIELIIHKGTKSSQQSIKNKKELRDTAMRYLDELEDGKFKGVDEKEK